MAGLEALKIVEKDCEDLEQVPYGEFAIIEKSLIQAEQDRKAIELLKKGFKFEFDENIDIGGLMYIKNLNKKIVVTKHYDKEQLDLLKQVIEVEK